MNGATMRSSRTQLTCCQLSANLRPLAGRHAGLGLLQVFGSRGAGVGKLMSIVS